MDAVASATAIAFSIFWIIFLVPDFVRRGSCISSFAGPKRACCGSLESESIKIQKGCKNYFYFFENIFSESA